MTPTRVVLSWLLSAALLLLGLPPGGDRTCADAGSDAAVGCCTGGECPCQPDASRECHCRTPAPDPAPPPPAPKQPLDRTSAEPLPAPPAAAPPASGRAPRPSACTRPHGLLPQVSRQEALSVWRL